MYCDYRKLIIREVNGFPIQESVQSFTYIDLTVNEDSDENEIRSVILKEIEKTGQGCSFCLDDNLHITSWGASGAGHEIILTLTSAFISGAAGAIINNLIQWALSKKNMANQEISIEDAIQKAKWLLGEEFGASDDKLTTAQVNKIGDEIKIIFRNMSCSYKVSIRFNGDIIRADKIPLNKND